MRVNTHIWAFLGFFGRKPGFRGFRAPRGSLLHQPLRPLPRGRGSPFRDPRIPDPGIGRPRTPRSRDLLVQEGPGPQSPGGVSRPGGRAGPPRLPDPGIGVPDPGLRGGFTSTPRAGAPRFPGSGRPVPGSRGPGPGQPDQGPEGPGNPAFPAFPRRGFTGGSPRGVDVKETPPEPIFPKIPIFGVSPGSGLQKGSKVGF